MALAPQLRSVADAQRYVEDFVAANTAAYLDKLHRIALGPDPKEARLAIAQLQDRAMGKASVPDRDTGLEKIEGILKAVAEIAHGVREPVRVIEGSAGPVYDASPLRLPAADAEGDGAGSPADAAAD